MDVSSADGFQKTVEVPMAGGLTPDAVTDLPVQKELTFVITALALDGEVLTKGEKKATLNAGQNSLSVTLAPDPSAVTVKSLGDISSSIELTIDNAAITLLPGKAKFYRVEYTVDQLYERFIHIETNKMQWFWLKVYDENWNPLPAVAQDEALGWSVIRLPQGTGVFHVAVANILASPLYPAGPIEGTLFMRQCVFVKPGGSGTMGYSTDPAPLQTGSVFTGLYTKRAILLQSGVYVASEELKISTNDRFYIIGGFAPDWKTRAGKTEIILDASSSFTSLFNIGESSSPNVFIDNINAGIQGIAFGTGAVTKIGMQIKNGAKVRLMRSNVTGVLDSNPSGFSGQINSHGIQIEDGVLEVFASAISGGNAINPGSSDQVSSTGIVIVATTSVTVKLYTSLVDGGYAVSPNLSGETNGIKSNGASSIFITRCKIYGGTAVGATGAVATGIKTSSQAGLIVMSSMLSGGYAKNTDMTNTYNAQTVALNIADNAYLVIAGNVIDTGIANAIQDARRFINGIVVWGLQSPNTELSGNIFICSAPGIGYGDASAIYSEDSSQFNDGLGNYRLRAVKQNFIAYADNCQPLTNYIVIAGTDNSAAYQLENGYTPVAGGYGNFFEQYALPASFNQNRFSEWISSNTWKVKPAFVSWTSNTSYSVVPSFFSTILTDGSESIFYFDLTGSPRPQNGMWRIGAYE